MTGKTTQLTFFNNQRPQGNPITNMSDPCWDWTGTHVLLDYVPADNTTHLATESRILKFSLIVKSASSGGSAK